MSETVTLQAMEELLDRKLQPINQKLEELPLLRGRIDLLLITLGVNPDAAQHVPGARHGLAG